MNERYEQFLQRKFPRFYLLYSTFMKGFRLLLSDAKEVGQIKVKMAKQDLQFHELSYREMEKVRQFRRNILKAAPVVLISIPPFANYLVFLLMYLFPRQLLIPHFWTPTQHTKFLAMYHRMRTEDYPEILNGIAQAVPQAPERTTRYQMHRLLAKIQNSSHPEIAELQEVAPLFSESPLCLAHLSTSQMKALSRVMFLTPYFPSFILRRRLRSHTYELHQLDTALLKLGVKELSDEELRMACYIRGLNSTNLSPAECRPWLTQWLQLSDKLKESEASLLLHSMVLLSTNYLHSIKH
ncbi:LETM1 domain-containing protein 1 isoform X2 [Ambystoma mexicanum]